MTAQPTLYPVTQDTISEVFDFVFAPWIKEMGLRDFYVEKGRVSAQLPKNEKLNFVGGALCGQAIMASIDTVTVLAMLTTDRPSKGTV